MIWQSITEHIREVATPRSYTTKFLMTIKVSSTVIAKLYLQINSNSQILANANNQREQINDMIDLAKPNWPICVGVILTNS